jgi:beta-lactamase class D
MKKIVPAVLLLTSTLFAKGDTVETDFSTFFGAHDGTIVVYDASSDRYVVHNRERSTRRFTPFSTFKIPNSCIALETGIITDVDSAFSWDTTKYRPEVWWPETWNARHTMRTAIEYSVVPFYREIASRIGSKRMAYYLKKFNYGNADNSSGIDNFWLDGSLAISAMEQLAFLVKFYRNELGIATATTDAVKDILVREKKDGYTLSAKTGGGSFLKDRPDVALGWYVGYVERGKRVWFFALNIDGTSFEDVRDARIDIARSALRRLKIID